MAATNKIVAEWLPREDLPTPRTLTCSVLDTRHRGRVVFFAGVRDEASQQTIQLIFRGSSTPGGRSTPATCPGPATAAEERRTPVPPPHGLGLSERDTRA